MAHHGSNPFEGMPKVAEEFRKIMKDNNVGATGMFPEGKIDSNDEGELRFVVVRHGQKIVMSYGKPVEWVGFDADQAIELATLLVKHAGEAKGVPMTLRIGRE